LDGNEVEAIGSRSTTAFRRHLDSAGKCDVVNQVSRFAWQIPNLTLLSSGVKYNLPFQINNKENEATSKEVLSDLEYLESINPGST
jgi:hypothetical protein